LGRERKKIEFHLLKVLSMDEIKEALEEHDIKGLKELV
jgi:hypothetical protein